MSDGAAIHGIEVLPARDAERPHVVDLLLANGLPTDDLPRSLEHFFVAQAAGGVAGRRLIGCAGLELVGDDLALFRSLAVDAAWRGQGLARRLFGGVLDRARGTGTRELFLLTTAAAPLFARWGFEAIARADAPAPVRATPEFRSLCPASAQVMRLPIARVRDAVL